MNWPIIVVVLILSVGLFSSTFAQSDNLPSVLQDAEKSLKAQTDKPSVSANKTLSIPKNKTTVSIPKNADIYFQTKLTYNPDSTLWYIPSNSAITFVKPNKICPELVCIQEFQRVAIDKYPDKLSIIGTLKVEDKKGSTADLRSWKIFEVKGWDIKITKVMQDIKSNETISIFTGLFALDIQNQAGVTSGVNYRFDGTFQEPSGLFQFVGKETRYY